MADEAENRSMTWQRRREQCTILGTRCTGTVGREWLMHVGAGRGMIRRLIRKWGTEVGRVIIEHINPKITW
jgi:hypothetical protein